MMKTLNVSLTPQLVRLVDQLMEDYGFANRSEFFRALLRFCKATKPTIHTFPFEEPPIRAVPEVLDQFKKTGKYSDQFLAGLKRGMKRSSYFRSGR